LEIDTDGARLIGRHARAKEFAGLIRDELERTA
jgi:hypothetical protein